MASDLKLPKSHRSVLSCGLRLQVTRRQPLPLVAIRLLIPAGSALDPKGREGLADLTARMLKKGTDHLSAEQISEEVEFVGGSLGANASEDFTVISLSAPSEHIETMLRILGQLVRDPAFPKAELEKMKRRTLAQFANDRDDPSVLADRAILAGLWGSHPYGHDSGGTEVSISDIQRRDVVSFHRNHLGPQTAFLLVVGAADPRKVHQLAEKSFQGWVGGKENPLPLPDPPGPSREGSIRLIDKSEQTQSQVRIAGVGFEKGNPDYFAALVANAVLGGGFTSRLVEEIRVNRGLSYSVGSHFDSLKAGGGFFLSTFTKNETTGEIIEVALAEAAKMREANISKSELTKTLNYIYGHYPARLETNEYVASVLADISLFELGDDWVECYHQRLFSVSVAAVRSAAEEYFFSTPPAIVVVGNASKVAPQLKSFGRLEVLTVADVP